MTRAETIEAGTRRREKTPAARLLDMLAGWSNLVEGQEQYDGHAIDLSVSVDDLCQIYQDAGGALLEVRDEDSEGEKEFVRRFVEERVLPTLMK